MPVIQMLVSIPSSALQNISHVVEAEATEHDKPNELHCEDHIVVSLGFEAAEHFLGSSTGPTNRMNCIASIVLL